MSEKFSIIKSVVDFEKLNKEVDAFMMRTGKSNPYLFMNKETISVMVRDAKTDIIYDYLGYHITHKAKSDDVIGRYHGYRVFADNELDFGEVEIR